MAARVVGDARDPWRLWGVVDSGIAGLVRPGSPVENAGLVQRGLAALVGWTSPGRLLCIGPPAVGYRPWTSLARTVRIGCGSAAPGPGSSRCGARAARRP